MALVTIMCVVFGVFAANKYNLTKEQEGNVAKLEADLAKVQDEIQQLRYEIYGGPEKIAENRDRLLHPDENWELQRVHAIQLELKEKYPDKINLVRGKGLLVGVQMKEGFKSDVIASARTYGLLLAGAGNEVVRFLPPLNVKEEELDEAAARFEKALKE